MLRRKIIRDRFAHGGHAKRYRTTPEQLEQNEREKIIQRERDQRARERAFGESRTDFNQEPQKQKE